MTKIILNAARRPNAFEWGLIASLFGVAMIVGAAAGLNSPYYGGFNKPLTMRGYVGDLPLPPLPPEAGAIPTQPPEAQPTLW